LFVFFYQAKYKAVQLKIALAIAIIRNKSNELTLDEYINLLASTFCKSFVENREQISRLKLLLFESKKEAFYRENSNILSEMSLSSHNNELFRQQISSEAFLKEINKQIQSPIIHDSLNHDQFLQSINFICNICKLKTFSKNFRLTENHNDTILECLTYLFKQIGYFLHCYLKQDENQKVLSFPIESIFHAIQLFINIFEIEWFYYMRDNLLGLINSLVKSLLEQFLLVENLEKVFFNFLPISK
jgi:hypothetical protein